MNLKATPRAAGVVALIAALAACNSTTSVASHYVASQNVTASVGGTVSVTSSEDATLAGTAVVIPANALSANTTITIAEGNSVISGQLQAAGPVADFGPDGTTFSTPVTITLPFTLPSGASQGQLEVVAIEADGTASVIANSSLTFGSNTVSFSAHSFTRFGCVTPPISTCPSGEFFCGCPGFGGSCISDSSQIACVLNCPFEPADAGAVCPAGQTLCCGVCSDNACPNLSCVVDAGARCPTGESYCDCTQECIPNNAACPACAPLDGGASLCPPGETPCCPGDPSSCVPSNSGVCPGSCLEAADAGVTCPPGDYYCGCPGYAGTCIPNKQSCVLSCPVEGVDAGVVCPKGQSECCGICQAGGCVDQGCVSPGDAGVIGTCPSNSFYCACTQQCVSDSSACPDCEPQASDAGTSSGSCPSGEFFCGCGTIGTCEPLGTVCIDSCPAQGIDAG